MRLAVLLTTRNEGARLSSALHQLARALDRMDRLVIIDEGSQDDTRACLRAFAAGPGRGGHIVCLEQGEASPKVARELARRMTGAEYVLALGRRDLLRAGVVAALEARLQAERPDVMICPHGWWVAGPSSVLPGPDAARLAALAMAEAPAPKERYLELLPDPRRLLLRDPEAEARCWQAGQSGELVQEWESYDAVIEASAPGAVGVMSDMVTLRPLPQCRAARAITAARAVLDKVMWRKERMRVMARLLPRIADELTQVDPAETDAVIAAARDVFGVLIRRERRTLRKAPGLAERLLVAAGTGDHVAAAAIVTQLAAVRDRACMRAVSEEITQLRTDIDRALPGPDYLMELYERVRPR